MLLLLTVMGVHDSTVHVCSVAVFLTQAVGETQLTNPVQPLSIGLSLRFVLLVELDGGCKKKNTARYALTK